MLKPATSKTNRSSSVRVVVAALVGALLIYIGVQVLGSSGASSHAVMLGGSCALPETSYTVVQVYKGDPKLFLSMFVFPSGIISEEVIAHGRKKGEMSQTAHHKFYSETLCQSCKGAIALDVGAFIGTHALVLARLGYEVHAFEPQRDAAELLRCSAQANGMSSMQVLQKGISDKNGEECMIYAMASAAHLAMVTPQNLNISDSCDPIMKVPIITLDTYWKEALNSKQIAFIKIDAEGHELAVLRGAKELVAQAPPPHIMLEYYPAMLKINNVSGKDLLDLITSYKYRIYDCQQKVEILSGRDGENTLAIVYQRPSSMTELLLVHTSVAPEGKELPEWDCGY